LLWSNSRVH